LGAARDERRGQWCADSAPLAPSFVPRRLGKEAVLAEQLVSDVVPLQEAQVPNASRIEVFSDSMLAIVIT